MEKKKKDCGVCDILLTLLTPEAKQQHKDSIRRILTLHITTVSINTVNTLVNILNKINTLNILNTLNTQEKIVLFSISKLTITELSWCIGQSVASISLQMKRNSDFLFQYIEQEYSEDKATRYKITKEGIKYFESKIKDIELRNERLIETASNYTEQTQIQKFEDIIDTKYRSKLFDNIRKGKTHLSINYKHISSYDCQLAEDLLESPDETLKSAEHAIKHFDIDDDIKKVTVCISNLPISQKIKISEIRSEHIGKFLFFDGVIRRMSEVRPQVTTARFECPACGNLLSVIQLDQKFKEPTKCGCGRKGKFLLLKKELVDAMGIVIEEDYHDLDTDVAKRINCFLKGILVTPQMLKRIPNGTRARFVGQIKEVPIITRNGGQSTTFDIMCEVNSFESLEDLEGDIKITDEDEKNIIGFSKSSECYNDLISLIAPNILEYEYLKEAIMVSLFGGNKTELNDGNVLRGDIHVLAAGEPGVGKTEFLKRSVKLARKSRYITGEMASKAGISAAVVKDDILKNWALEVGALVLASGGVCAIDEFDKLDKEDRKTLNTALEKQQIIISKASIQATLKAETTVHVALNPKHGYFDDKLDYQQNVGIPSSTIDRFDLSFRVEEVTDSAFDSKFVKFCFDKKRLEFDDQFVKKYIYYARENIHPRWPEKSKKQLTNWYIAMRRVRNKSNFLTFGARQLNAAKKVCEAVAKAHISTEVKSNHIKKGLKLINKSMVHLGCVDSCMLPGSSNKCNDNKKPNKTKEYINQIREIIINLEKDFGKSILISSIINKAKEIDIAEVQVTNIIEKLKSAGDVFESYPGKIQRI